MTKDKMFIEISNGKIAAHPDNGYVFLDTDLSLVKSGNVPVDYNTLAIDGWEILNLEEEKKKN